MPVLINKYLMNLKIFLGLLRILWGKVLTVTWRDKNVGMEMGQFHVSDQLPSSPRTVPEDGWKSDGGCNGTTVIHSSIRPWRGANKCFCGRAIRIRSAEKKNRNTIIEKGLRMNNYPIAEYNSITRQHDAYKCQE